MLKAVKKNNIVVQMKAEIVVQNTNPEIPPSPAATATKPIKLMTWNVQNNKIYDLQN